jgi:hypothetical protein
LDPQVAAKVGARADALSAVVRAEGAASLTAEPVKPLEPIWSVFALGVAVFVVAMYACIFFHWGGVGILVPLTLGPVGFAGFGALVGLVAPVNGGAPSAVKHEARRQRHTPQRRGPLHADDALRDAFQGTEMTRAERAYGDVILLLADEISAPASRARVRASQARFVHDLLNECNRLLDSHARLEARHRHVSRLLDGGRAGARAEAEHDALRRRWEEEPDLLAREALRESVEMCAERLQSVRALGLTLARLEAHQEVICQALSLAHTALAHRQATPSGALAAPDVSALRAIARRIAGETRAEEEALAEVGRL